MSDSGWWDVRGAPPTPVRTCRSIRDVHTRFRSQHDHPHTRTPIAAIVVVLSIRAVPRLHHTPHCLLVILLSFGHLPALVALLSCPPCLPRAHVSPSAGALSSPPSAPHAVRPPPRLSLLVPTYRFFHPLSSLLCHCLPVCPPRLHPPLPTPASRPPACPRPHCPRRRLPSTRHLNPSSPQSLRLFFQLTPPAPTLT